MEKGLRTNTPTQMQTQNVYGSARMQLVASNEILLNALGILAFVNASAAGAERVCVCHTHIMLHAQLCGYTH